jgi:chromosome segregation ATPase
MTYNSQEQNYRLARLEEQINNNVNNIDKLKSEIKLFGEKTSFLERQLEKLTKQSESFYSDMQKSQNRFEDKIDKLQTHLNGNTLMFNDIKHKFDNVETYQQNNENKWNEFMEEYKVERNTQIMLNMRLKIYGAIILFIIALSVPKLSEMLLSIL